MERCSRYWLAVAATIVVVALANPPRLGAQLIVENPSRKWRAGERVELIVRGPEVRPGARIEEVRFDGRPIAFTVVDQGSRQQDVIRIEIGIPLVVRPGEHQVSVRFSELPLVTVPDLRGMRLGESRRLLGERGLSVDTGAVGAPPEGAFLVVMAHEPRPGAQASLGDRVAVEVVGRSEVPEIVGLEVDEARLRLEARALELALSVPPSQAPSQRVSRQDPGAGEILAVGSTVTVETVLTVPHVVGRRADEARSILSDFGLRFHPVFVESAAGPYRTVLAQEPAAGEGVPPGSSVGLVFERLADPPSARLPWGWIALTGALGATLAQRARVRRLRRNLRVKCHTDLEGLRASATAPASRGREFKLDVRLLGVPDPGRQWVEIHGPVDPEINEP